MFTNGNSVTVGFPYDEREKSTFPLCRKSHLFKVWKVIEKVVIPSFPFVIEIGRLINHVSFSSPIFL